MIYDILQVKGAVLLFQSSDQGHVQVLGVGVIIAEVPRCGMSCLGSTKTSVTVSLQCFSPSVVVYKREIYCQCVLQESNMM